MDVIGIEVCGAFALAVDGGRVGARLPGRQGPLVIAFLALNRSRGVARDELVELVWPDGPPPDPVEALSALLSKVRRVVGRDAIGGRRELRLAPAAAVELDWEEVVGGVARARAALSGGDHRVAWGEARGALELAERGFLSGYTGPWVEERRRDLEELRHAALEVAAAAGIALGEPDAERFARVLVELAPFRESGHRSLMEALAARGDVAEALRVYDRLRVLLRDELGAAP